MNRSEEKTKPPGLGCLDGYPSNIPYNLCVSILADEDLMYHNHGDRFLPLIIGGLPGLGQVDHSASLVLLVLQFLHPLLESQTVPLELAGLLVGDGQ